MTDSYFSFDNQYQATGSYIYPPSATIAFAQQTIQIVDPVINAIASFFTQILQSNLLPRFANEAAACGLTHANLDSFVDGVAVAQTIIFPLNEQTLKVSEFRFPLLAVQPIHEHFISFTMTKVSTERNFKVAYILPPLTPFQYNRLYPFLGLASKALLAYGNQGYDPKVSTTSIWQQVGLSFGFMGGASYEPYDGLNKGDGKAFFPTVELDLSFVERNQSPVVENYPDTFNEIDMLQINLFDGYSPANPINNFVDGYVIPNITITSCTPNSGSIQGNTLIVIQGTGFASEKISSPSQITICGSPVSSFVVRSPTIIQAITTAVIGYNNESGDAITGDIVITDNQDNEYTLTNGFSYTYP